MALTFKVYKLGLTFPGGGNAVMAKSDEVDVELVSMSDLERVLETEEGGFRLGNVSAVVRGLDDDYFDTADNPNAPFVFEIADGATAIFHGPVAPASIVRDEATGYFSFEVLAWEAMLALVNSIPARSVYEANVRSVQTDAYIRVYFPIADLDNINAEDILVADSDVGEFRERIIAKGAITDTSFRVSLVAPAPKTIIEPFDDSAFVWNSATPIVWQFGPEEGRLFMQLLPANSYTTGGMPVWAPLGGEKVFVEFLNGNQVIESTRIISARYNTTNPNEPIVTVTLDPNDFDGSVVSSNGGPTGTMLFTQVTIKGIAAVTPGNKVRILGRDIYGVNPVDASGVKFHVEDIIEALLFLGENNEPTESYGRPLGILPNVIRNIDIEPSGATLVRGESLDNGIELPDRPIEALRLLQRTCEFHINFVPVLDAGLPRVDVKLIPRAEIGTDTPVNLNKVIRSWNTRVVPEKVTAVVVKPNEDYRKPDSETEYIGVWWVNQNGETPDDMSDAELRYLTVPSGPGVMEIEVAVQPAYVADYFFLGGGKPVGNDNVLKVIAQSAYDYYAKAGQRFSAALRVNYGTDLLGSRWNVNESGFIKTIFVTRTSTSIRDNQYNTTVEGIVEPFVTAGTGATPIAVISGVLNYPAVAGQATVHLNGVQSSNPSGEPLSYAWRRRERVGGVYGAWSGVLSTTAFLDETLTAGVYEYELRVHYTDSSAVLHEDFDYEVVSISVITVDYPGGGGGEPEIRFIPFERADAADQVGNLMFDPDSGDGDGNVKGLQLNYEGTNESWGTLLDTFNSPGIDAEFLSVSAPNDSEFLAQLKVGGPLLVNGATANGFDSVVVLGSVGISPAVGTLRFTGATSGRVVALGTILTLEQTGDTSGQTSLALANRSGWAGVKIATTTGAGANITDLIFDAPAVVDAYIRYEGRSGTAKFGSRAFHFSTQATPDSPDFAIGVNKVGAGRMIVGSWTDDDATKTLQVNGNSVFKGSINTQSLVVGDDNDGDFVGIVNGGYFRLDSFGMPLYLNGLSNEEVFIGEDSPIGTQAFTSGFGGAGWRVQEQAGYVGYVGTLDNLFVRGSLVVYELIINQIRATNGSLFVSSAARVKEVSYLGSSRWRLTFEGDGSGYIHPFALNDLLIAQRRAAGAIPGVYIYRSFFRVDTLVNNYTVEGVLDGGTDPGPGFDYVRYGNTTNTNRQGYIYLTADDQASPFIAIRDGIDSMADWTNSSTERVRIGRLDGRSPFAGVTGALYGFLSGDTTAFQVSVTAENSLGGGTGGMEFWNGATLRGFVRSSSFYFSSTTNGAYMLYNSSQGAEIGYGDGTEARVNIHPMTGITIYDETGLDLTRIEAGGVRIGIEADTRTEIDSTSVRLYNWKNQKITEIAEIVTIGLVASRHVQVSDTTVRIYNGSNILMEASGNTLSVGTGFVYTNAGINPQLQVAGWVVTTNDIRKDGGAGLITIISSTNRSFSVFDNTNSYDRIKVGDFAISTNHPYTPSDATLVVNPSFESALGAEWVNGGGAGSSISRIAGSAPDYTNPTGDTGSWILKMTPGPVGVNYTFGVTQTVTGANVTALRGKSVYVRFSLASNGDASGLTQAKAQVKFNSSLAGGRVGTEWNLQSYTWSPDPTWRVFETTITVPTDADDFYFNVQGRDSNEKDWYLDFIQVKVYERTLTELGRDGLLVFNAPQNYIRASASGVDLNVPYAKMQYLALHSGGQFIPRPAAGYGAIFFNGNILSVRKPDGTYGVVTVT